ncbi:hypothetical protein SLEP1_g51548 [Rubroshorea leprosula]|uniref:Uncharacterized protein n=1 Tax=Rubroshorea leprosula TaxID=152421 RepID=A0AAV5M518_9ROSI|nr:hypothetical protein SLEP1_g51548 [Rubroshorea leprosula]
MCFYILVPRLVEWHNSLLIKHFLLALLGTKKGKDEGFRGSIDTNRVAPNESKLEVGDVVKRSISNKSKMDVDKTAISAAKKVASPNGAGHSGQPSSALAESSKADDSALRLLNNLNEMDRDVSLARFGMAMGYIEVTPFAKMNEDFFYLCRDAIDDVESINFKVGPIQAYLLNLEKAYLGKVEFSMAGCDTVGDLDKWIEQMKHVKEMEKSLAKMKELILKLEERLMSIKAYLQSLNQENECLSSNNMIELCQTCIKTAKTFRDKLSPFRQSAAIYPSLLFVFYFASFIVC